MIFEILVASLCIMVTSLVGVMFTARVASDFLASRLSFLVSFSAGVFLITAGALALEVFEIYESALWQGIVFIIAGYGLAWGVERVLPESHHHHDPHSHDGHTHDFGGAKKILIADAIHNVGDGIMLVPAFLVSPALGLAVTVSVIIHETLQEISEFFVLKQAGYSTRRALFLNFVTSSTVLIGVGLSYFAVVSHELEGLLLAVAAGFFIHVVIHDLLPRRSRHETPSVFLQHVLLVAVGLAGMAAVNVVLGDSHEHGESEHSDHGEHVDEMHNDHN